MFKDISKKLRKNIIDFIDDTLQNMDILCEFLYKAKLNGENIDDSEMNNFIKQMWSMQDKLEYLANEIELDGDYDWKDE